MDNEKSNSIYMPNDYSTCSYLLPCGICSKTNQYCPLRGWRSNDQPVVYFSNKCECKAGQQEHGCQ